MWDYSVTKLKVCWTGEVLSKRATCDVHMSNVLTTDDFKSSVTLNNTRWTLAAQHRYSRRINDYYKLSTNVLLLLFFPRFKLHQDGPVTTKNSYVLYSAHCTYIAREYRRCLRNVDDNVDDIYMQFYIRIRWWKKVLLARIPAVYCLRQAAHVKATPLPRP